MKERKTRRKLNTNIFLKETGKLKRKYYKRKTKWNPVERKKRK